MEKESSEKSRKRKLKTTSQVEALEKHCKESEYPSEFRKSKMAEETGLTQKQVSGWFCHRRLKDKRLLRDDRFGVIWQDHSIGVIQDGGQDSRGSAKHGNSFIDPKVGESRRPYCSNFSSGDNDGKENNSSQSCSSLQDRMISDENLPLEIETSRYSTLGVGGFSPSSVPKVSRSWPYKPSGYLKAKGEIKNAAVTSVKTGDAI